MDLNKIFSEFYKELVTSSSTKQEIYYIKATTHYQKYLELKDTLYNEEKSKSIGKLEARHEFALTEIERERNEKAEAVALLTAVTKRDRFQFMSIFIVVTFAVLIVSLILFSKFKISSAIKSRSVFIALLLLFEFLLVWLDTPMEKFTGGDPVFKLLINAILALGFYFILQGTEKLITNKYHKIPIPITPKQFSSIFIPLLVVSFSFVHLCAFAPLRDTSFTAREDVKNVQKKFNAENAESKKNAENAKRDSLKLLLTQYQSQVTTFQSQNKIKEAYEALKKYGAVKDSLQQHEQSQEVARINEKHSVEIQKAKEMAIANEKAKIEKAKKNRLNLLKDSGVFIFIMFLFGSLLMFNKFKISNFKFQISYRILEGGLFVSFLLLFEFILVLFDPWLEQITGGAPAWKMGFNVVIAVLISPLHSILEQKMKRKMFKEKVD